MSHGLPESTKFNRFVAKSNFYKQTGITTKIRDAIEQQIEKITWTNKISPKTLNISEGKLHEFQTFDIRLKTSDIDHVILEFIQKSVPYPIIFTLFSSRGCRVAAVMYFQKKPIVVSTQWEPDVSLELKGNSTDAIYKNYLFQVSSDFAAVNGDIEKYTEVMKITKNITALSAKARKEMQINKRQEIARERHALEVRLQELRG